MKANLRPSSSSGVSRVIEHKADTPITHLNAFDKDSRHECLPCWYKQALRRCVIFQRVAQLMAQFLMHSSSNSDDSSFSVLSFRFQCDKWMFTFKLTLTVISSAAQWICITAEYPAQIIDLCSKITTWASKILPVLIGLEASHKTKPGETSSSSIP